MKTLDQVEPRTPIASVPFVLSAAGSYYLTGNLVYTGGTDGVTIAADDVTLDLGGFAIQGGIGSGDGIVVSGLRSNICVRNGTIAGWGGKGLNGTNAVAGRFLELRAHHNGGWGIHVGERAVVQGCVALGNVVGISADFHSLLADCMSTRNSDVGVRASAGGTIRDCVAVNNGGPGFSAGDVSTFSGCSSRDNGGQGFALGAGSSINSCAATANGPEGFSTGQGAAILNSSARSNGKGFFVGPGSTLRNCLAMFNGGNGIEADVNCIVAGCSATANGAVGIGVGVGGVVENCAARENTSAGIVGGTGTRITGCSPHYNGIGISVPNDCVVAENTVYGNYQDGIAASLDNNRIEANNVTTNANFGISVSEAGNIIVRNSARGNSGGNYSIAAGNAVGDIVDVSGGTVISTANPWANFSF